MDLKTVLTVISMVVAAVSAFFAWQIASQAGFNDLTQRVIALEKKPDRVRTDEEIQELFAGGAAVGVSETQLQQALDGIPSRRSDQEIMGIVEDRLAVFEANSDFGEQDIRSWIKDALLPLEAFREMKGAVIAFDRSEDRGGGVVGGACPLGWELFRPAGGRFIIGAGAHQNIDELGDDLKDYRAFSDDPDDAVGGAETHKLKKDEMPVHDHRLTLLYGDDRTGGRLLQGGDAPQTARRPDAGITEESGGASPHNNMPPYIALYFCKKESSVTRN